MTIYKFRKYRKDYEKIFKKEKSKLLRILPKGKKIEHIGSTAVPGLGGKGIIDIIIGVKKNNLEKIKKILENNSYVHKDTLDGRYFFINESGYLKKQRTHVHLTVYNNKIWKKALKFRDYLNKNKKAQKEYVKLKKEACKICKGEGKIYRKHKEEFIKKILRVQHVSLYPTAI